MIRRVTALFGIALALLNRRLAPPVDILIVLANRRFTRAASSLVQLDQFLVEQPAKRSSS